jgi:hypothetical protein
LQHFARVLQNVGLALFRCGAEGQLAFALRLGAQPLGKRSNDRLVVDTIGMFDFSSITPTISMIFPLRSSKSASARSRANSARRV